MNKVVTVQSKVARPVELVQLMGALYTASSSMNWIDNGKTTRGAQR